MTSTLAARVESAIRRYDLIPTGGDVVCLVSGGADSTCLWHVLGALGYRVSAVHVNHGLRAGESNEDARHCHVRMGAEVIDAGDSLFQSATEAALRQLRYELTEGCGLRATGHTASDQVETILYRLVSSGTTKAIKAKREDGVVRPLLSVEEETGVLPRARPPWVDSSNADTSAGSSAARSFTTPRAPSSGRRNLLALAETRPRLPRALERALSELLSTTDGTRSLDLGDDVRAVREYDEVRLEGRVTFGPWRLESTLPGLSVRTRRPGDRLAGRRKKVQDLFVDAKVPRLERDEWPLVVSGSDVVSVPGIAEAPGWEGTVRAWKDTET
jgi:tRNA(Ile)-lysidine synthase